MDDRDQSVNWTNDDLAFTELKGRSIGFVTGILGLSGMLWGLSQIKFEQPVQALPLTSTAPIASPTQVVQSAKTAKDWFDQANRKAEKQDFKGAIEDYTKAIKLKPDYAEVYYKRGIYRNLNHYKGGIEDYSKAIEINPNYAEAYYNRGKSRSSIGDEEGAIEDFSRAIELKSDDAITYYFRAADLYQKQGETQNYQDALDRIKDLQE
jgi:tetratricopeptide (TPR) repeat protein